MKRAQKTRVNVEREVSKANKSTVKTAKGNGSVCKNDTLHDAAGKVLRKYVTQMTDNEGGTREGTDAECLHDMRVAARRLRTALSTFRAAFDGEEVRALREELKWLGGALGSVRDWDVHMDLLIAETDTMEHSARDHLNPYVEWLRSEREAARRVMLEALHSKRYKDLVERLTRLHKSEMSTSAPTNGPETLASLAPSILKRAARNSLLNDCAFDPKSPDEALHQLRKDVKRFRYTCEFVAPLYGGSMKNLIDKLKVLQGILGTHQDAVVAQHLILSGAETLSKKGPQEIGLYLSMGRLMQIQRELQGEARSGWHDIWIEVAGKKHRKSIKNIIAGKAK